MAVNANDPKAVFRAAQSAMLREHFCGRTRAAKQSDPPAIAVAVNDWQALELALLTPSDMEHNPGGPDLHQVIVPEAKRALAEQDAEALGELLVLLLKGLWHSA